MSGERFETSAGMQVKEIGTPFRLSGAPVRITIEVEPPAPASVEPDAELRAAARRVLAFIEEVPGPPPVGGEPLVPYFRYEHRAEIPGALAELRRLAGH